MNINIIMSKEHQFMTWHQANYAANDDDYNPQPKTKGMQKRVIQT